MTAPGPDWIDRTRYPFQDRHLRVDGHDLHYLDEGDGPLLLMLHGNPTWSFVWRDVVVALRDGFRCIALDLPEFGLSQAPEAYDGRAAPIAAVVQRFVQDLDLQGVVLVAQDWGGPIGLSVAQHLPERFSGLALGNTWAWPVTGDSHFERFSGLMGGSLGAWLTRRANLFVNLMIPVGHRLRRPSRAEMQHYRRALATPQRRQASAVLPREIVRAAPFLAQVASGPPALRTKPALLLWADRDIAFRSRSGPGGGASCRTPGWSS